jgi:hypothetical protein
VILSPEGGTFRQRKPPHPTPPPPRHTHLGSCAVLVGPPDPSCSEHADVLVDGRGAIHSWTRWLSPPTPIASSRVCAPCRAPFTMLWCGFHSMQQLHTHTYIYIHTYIYLCVIFALRWFAPARAHRGPHALLCAVGGLGMCVLVRVCERGTGAVYSRSGVARRGRCGRDGPRRVCGCAALPLDQGYDDPIRPHTGIQRESVWVGG